VIGGAIEVEIEAPVPEPNVAHFEFALVRDGYLWNFPKAKVHSIGIGSFGKHKVDLKRPLACYVDSFGLSLDDVTLHGHPLLLWKGPSVLHTEAALLCGEAACIAMNKRYTAQTHALQYGQLGPKPAPGAAYIAGPWKNAKTLTAGISGAVEKKGTLAREVFFQVFIHHLAPEMTINVMYFIRTHFSFYSKIAHIVHHIFGMIFWFPQIAPPTRNTYI